MKIKKIVSIIAVVGIILGFLVPILSVFFEGKDSGVSYNSNINII